VIVMMRSGIPSPLASEFDDFLFAPIGEDNNGMPLGVVSALARLDVDPWVQADKLLRLPGKVSVVELASIPIKLDFKSAKNLQAIEVTNIFPSGYWEKQGYDRFSGV